MRLCFNVGDGAIDVPKVGSRRTAREVGPYIVRLSLVVGEGLCTLLKAGLRWANT